MPMPKLDPNRFIEAVLADPSHTLPMPDRGGRMFMKEGEVVDAHDPFYATLLADGSLRPKPAQAKTEPRASAEEKSEVKPIDHGKADVDPAPKPMPVGKAPSQN